MLDDWDITHVRRDLPPQVWRFLKEKGFFGLIVPRRYGGLEFSAQAHSAVVMKTASRSVTAAVTVMVPNSLGPAELLLHYGTEAQKNHYLPRLASGEEVPCFALTNPEAGSDASAMPDHGVVCRGEFDGKKDVLGIRLNWEKRYITLGPVATVLGLAFKLYDPDHLLGGNENLGITLALIPTNTPGVKIGTRHNPLNIPFQNGPNWGEDVFIPLDWIIGGPERIGQGWRMLMESLAAGRSISLPALSTGAGKLACRATGAYAPYPQAVQAADRQVRRRGGGTGAHGGVHLPHGRHALAHGARRGPGREALGGLGDRQVPAHRAHAPRGERRHGRAGRRWHLPRAAQFHGARVPGAADLHHRRGREHFDAHAHCLRPGRGALPSLYLAGDARGDGYGHRTRIEKFR